MRITECHAHRRVGQNQRARRYDSLRSLCQLYLSRIVRFILTPRSSRDFASHTRCRSHHALQSHGKLPTFDSDVLLVLTARDQSPPDVIKQAGVSGEAVMGMEATVLRRFMEEGDDEGGDIFGDVDIPSDVPLAVGETSSDGRYGPFCRSAHNGMHQLVKRRWARGHGRGVFAAWAGGSRVCRVCFQL